MKRTIQSQVKHLKIKELKLLKVVTVLSNLDDEDEIEAIKIAENFVHVNASFLFLFGYNLYIIVNVIFKIKIQNRSSPLTL